MWNAWRSKYNRSEDVCWIQSKMMQNDNNCTYKYVSATSNLYLNLFTICCEALYLNQRTVSQARRERKTLSRETDWMWPVFTYEDILRHRLDWRILLCITAAQIQRMRAHVGLYCGSFTVMFQEKYVRCRLERRRLSGFAEERPIIARRKLFSSPVRQDRQNYQKQSTTDSSFSAVSKRNLSIFSAFL